MISLISLIPSSPSIPCRSCSADSRSCLFDSLSAPLARFDGTVLCQLRACLGCRHQGRECDFEVTAETDERRHVSVRDLWVRSPVMPPAQHASRHSEGQIVPIKSVGPTSQWDFGDLFVLSACKPVRRTLDTAPILRTDVLSPCSNRGPRPQTFRQCPQRHLRSS
jgi:hypothetical protein